MLASKSVCNRHTSENSIKVIICNYSTSAQIKIMLGGIPISIPPQINMSPKKGPSQKKKSSSKHQFSGNMLHPPKFNSSPLKNDAWRQAFPFEKAYLQGRTVLHHLERIDGGKTRNLFASKIGSGVAPSILSPPCRSHLEDSLLESPADQLRSPDKVG